MSSRNAGLVALLILPCVVLAACGFERARPELVSRSVKADTLLQTAIDWEGGACRPAGRHFRHCALTKALDDWYANAKDIADFLSGANPENWPTTATEPMMKKHIESTVTYAVDLLESDYAKAIADYGVANDHMMVLSDVLSKGIVAQFPDKFDS